MIDQLIDSAVVIQAIEATEKDPVLDAVVDAMAAHARLDPAAATGIRTRLQEREAVGSTGIGNGVAIPHVKVDGVERISLVVARTSDGVEWQAIDGEPVRIVFFLLGAADLAEQHLQALRWISSLARNPDFRRFVLSASDEGEIRDLLRELGSPS